MSKKINPLTLFLLVIVVLLGEIAAFLLGRASVLPEQQKSAISIEKAACLVPLELLSLDSRENNTVIPQNTSSGAFVASKNGSKYYPTDCSYVDRILPENRVWFQTASEAESNGFERSTQCKD